MPDVLPPKYDIEADWQLLNTCNYRCEYCFFPDAVLGEIYMAPPAVRPRTCATS